MHTPPLSPYISEEIVGISQELLRAVGALGGAGGNIFQLRNTRDVRVHGRFVCMMQFL